MRESLTNHSISSPSDMAFSVRSREATADWRQRPVVRVAGLLAFGLLYFVLARLAQVFFIGGEGITAVWPPSGLVLGVMLASRRRDWPWLLATVFASNAAAGAGASFVSTGRLAPSHSARPPVSTETR